MFTHHTKNKGDLGVAKATADLIEQGFMVMTPCTEHAPFDLVAYKDKKFFRVQVKYRELSKTGTVEVKFASNWADKYGVHTKNMDKTEVDIICVYCPQTRTCYYFNPSLYASNVTIRLMEAKNKQKKGIINGKDFLKMQA